VNIAGGIWETSQMGKEKKHRESFSTLKSWRAKKLLGIAHSDLCSVKIPTLESKKQFFDINFLTELHIIKISSF